MRNVIQDLHEEVLMDPYDTTVRRAYADALEESGDAARAETIQHMLDNPDCVLIFTNNDKYPRKSPNWWNVVSGDGWALKREDLFHLVEDLPPAFAKVVVRGGFLEEVHCPHNTWLKCGSLLCVSHPIVAVGITDRGPLQFMDNYVGWYAGDGIDEETGQYLSFSCHHVSHDLRAYLFAGRVLSAEHPDCFHYADNVAAYNDLSLACVNLARSHVQTGRPNQPTLRLLMRSKLF